MIGMNLQIMLIEDNPGDARLIREMLAEGGGVPFDLKNCDRLLTGLASLSEGGADVILLDLGLPDSQGLDTLRRLHALVPGVPIVVLTISGDEELGLKAVQEGAQDYLVKGHVDSNLLWRSLRYAIERNQAEQELRKHREHLEELVEKRTAELIAINEQLQQEITERMALAVSNAQLLEEAERRLKDMQALRNIDMAISSSLDLHVILNAVLEQIIKQLNIHAAAVLISKPGTQILEYAVGRGFCTRAREGFSLSLDEGKISLAVIQKRILSVPDLRQTEAAFLRTPLLADERFTAYYGVPLIAKGQVKGLLEIFHRDPLDPDQEWLDFMERAAGQAAIAIDNVTLFDGMQRSNIELTRAYNATIEGWSRALDMRDKETEGHSRRVTEMTVCLARAMGMREEELEHVCRGALLHDIGKLGVPDHILLKPGPLTEEEWKIMRRHTVSAYKMLLPIAYLRPALDIPYCHHEKWDGSGYPRGLKGEEIPLAARIFAVVDVWDALNSERPYRPAWPKSKAREYIRGQAGKQFDPKVVEVFLKMESRDLFR